MRGVIGLAVMVGLLLGGPVVSQEAPALPPGLSLETCAAAATIWEAEPWRPTDPHEQDERVAFSQYLRDIGWLAILAKQPMAKPRAQLYVSEVTRLRRDPAGYKEARTACQTADARRFGARIAPPPQGDGQACLNAMPKAPNDPELRKGGPEAKAKVCAALRGHLDAMDTFIARMERGELACRFPETSYLDVARTRVLESVLYASADCERGQNGQT
ncbi:MAG: hypothetical protein JSR45_16515 [Proteobacteria bacterium]|nr:hypothetical protein [Pseudomonadota bacterium]